MKTIENFELENEDFKWHRQMVLSWPETFDERSIETERGQWVWLAVDQFGDIVPHSEFYIDI